MQIKWNLILKSAIMLVCSLILLSIVFAPNLSMVVQRIDEDTESVPFDVYLIKSVSSSLPSDMAYVEDDIFGGWKNMNLFDFAKNSLDAAEVFQAKIEEIEEIEKMFEEEEKLYTEEGYLLSQYPYDKIVSMKTNCMLAKVGCYIAGIGSYLVFFCFILYAICMGIMLIGALVAKEKERPQLMKSKMTFGWSLAPYVFLILTQVFVAGAVNEILFMGGAGYIYRLVFSGGMHCLIPIVAVFLIYHISCYVIDQKTAW